MGLALRIGITLSATLIVVLVGLWLPVRQMAESEYRRQHDVRLQFRLQALRAEIETRISYGFALTAIPGIQEVIEGLRRDDPEIEAIDVFTPDGMTWFSTDRGLIGDAVPADWLERTSAAAEDGAGLWQTQRFGSEVSGLSIRNDLDEDVGFIALTTGDAAAPETLSADLWRTLGLVLAVVTALALLTGWVIALGPARHMRRFIAGLNGAADPQAATAGVRAHAQIAAAAQKLDLVSQRLAGADDDEP